MASFVSGLGSGSDIFVVEYETTTYAELSSAIASKKTIVMDGSSNGTNGFFPITQIKEDTTSNVISFDFCSWTESNVGGNNFTTVILVHFTVSNDETWDSTYRTLSNYIVAEYGTTTYNEIILGTANEDTQLTIVQYQGHYYIPSYRESGVSSVKLRCLNSTKSFIDFTVNADDEWSVTVTDIAQISKIWTGTCSTPMATAVKVVTLDDATGFSLIAGVKIAITFTYGVSSGTQASKLNVSNTGDIDISATTSSGGTVTGGYELICWGGNTTVFFTYTGSTWRLEGSGRLQAKSYNLASSAVLKSGGTMTGALTLSGAPTADLHAATKQYVDSKAGAPQVVSYTLAASGWSSNTYSGLQTTYPVAQYDISIQPDGDTITGTQYQAGSDAKFVGSRTTNVLKALGTVPTVDIPVLVTLTSK